MDWAQILVIILAVLFAVFLTVAIILVVVIIKVTRQIKTAAMSAERTIRSLEGSVSMFSKATLPLMITKGILNQIKRNSRVKERREKDE